MSDPIFYVYIHRSPIDHELVYVGKGCGGRAWDVTRNRGEHHDHQKWMQNLMEMGYLPSDWVTIVYRGLTEEDAFSKEKEFLHSNGTTRFNRQSGERNNQAKLTDAQVKEIFIRAKKQNHQELANEFGVSRSAISMIASRKQWRATTACLI